MRVLWALALALPGAANAEALECLVTEKCGASGMCVAAAEPLVVRRGAQRLEIAGLPGLTDPAALRIGADGGFVLRPTKAAFADPGTSFDHMAVRFAGHCIAAGGTP